MTSLDWGVVIAYSAAMVAIGVVFARQATRTVEHYFIAGRNMPWWAIGFSDVSSYGAGAAPFVMLFFIGGFSELWLIAWVSWCIWMPVVAIVWAKRWRRLAVMTTGEFIELRYGGTAARAYRGAYAIYAYLAWAVVLLAYVSVWFTQTIGPLLDWQPTTVLIVFGAVALLYTVLSGFIGVVYTEIIQFLLILSGGLVFMVIAIGAAGGLDQTYARVVATRGSDFLQPLPLGTRTSGLTLLALVLQGLFFAGSPFAGEGWTAQRAMSARDERHAILGQMFNCVLSLVVRLIPAIFIGLAAVALYPQQRVPVPAQLWAQMVREYAQPGLLGFLLAGALAAFMSGVSSITNWGTSYVLNDVYRRHVRKQASEGEYILVSRGFTAFTLVAAGALGLYIDPATLETWALFINSAVIVFSLPLAWLKWFWWRMNVYGDAVGMLLALPSSFVVWFGSDTLLPETFRRSVYEVIGWDVTGLVPRFGDLNRYPFWYGFAILFASGWIVILAVTLLTRPERIELLREFYLKTRPLGPWGPVARSVQPMIRSSIAAEARRDVQASLWGIAFCFLMVTAFFSAAADRGLTSLLCAGLCISAGYLFWRTALGAGAFRHSIIPNQDSRSDQGHPRSVSERP